MSDGRKIDTFVAVGCLAFYGIALFYDALFMRDPSWLQLEGLVGFNSRYPDYLNLLLIALSIGTFLAGCIGYIFSWAKSKYLLLVSLVFNILLIPAFATYLSSDVSSFASLLWAVCFGWLLASPRRAA